MENESLFIKYADQILDELKLNTFIVFDLETTGLDYLDADIIEFAGIKYQNGKPTDQLQMLLNPGYPIPENIIQITGITNEMVKDASAFKDRSEEILDFLGDYPLVAHNSDFDISFLEYQLRKIKHPASIGEAVKHNIVLTNPVNDTLLLARTFLPFLPGYALGKLAESLKIELGNAHRAAADAAATGELFLKIIEKAVKSEFRSVKKIAQILEPTEHPVKNFIHNLVKLLASGKFAFTDGPDKTTFEFSANYYNIIGEDETPESGRLDVEPISEQDIRNTLDKGGMFEDHFGPFEVREAQIEMAGRVSAAFNEQKFLVAEAGTGTGKSIAYLLPAIQWAIKNYGPYGRVVISTNTKNLQEQLFFKDIPILHSLLPEKFKTVLLKGKSNYLCLDKWHTVMKNMNYRLSDYEREKILPLVFWVNMTETGDIAENSGFVAERNMGLWSKFIAENNYCPGKKCKYYSDCFLWRARNNAKDAHLVLINHSLLFSDLATDQAILNGYTNLIIDEAHNIEKVATEYLGSEVSIWAFRDSLKKLYWKEKFKTGVLHQLRNRIQLSDIGDTTKDLILGHIDGLIPKVDETWKGASGFFKELTIKLQLLKGNSEQSKFTSRFRYTSSDGLVNKMESFHFELDELLRKLTGALSDFLEYLMEIPMATFEYQQQMTQEIKSQLPQLSGLRETLTYLLTAEYDDWVYWYELVPREGKTESRLYAAPLDISSLLYERMYKNINTLIFTSATLTVNKNFNYFMRRSGLNFLDKDRVDFLYLEAPFDYKTQSLVAVPAFVPDPRSANYRDFLKKFIETIADEHDKGTMVLFTAYSLLNDMYAELRAKLDAKQIPLLAQGKSGSRHAIINKFKEIPHSYLFGTDSFWEGVDIPGEALEMLLITKLPFAVPSDPVIQAKAESIEREGRNSFMEYTIPEAVIKFRQGFGRLIRSKNDRGVVIILDNRVVSKQYGKIFLNSLPAKSEVYRNEDEFWENLVHWFAKSEKTE